MCAELIMAKNNLEYEEMNAEIDAEYAKMCAELDAELAAIDEEVIGSVDID